ncbi:ribonuclease HII [Methanothermococcus sp. SCGC AD-155-C09]|nr:ribonuclease HII [Methanothermococcus sp. SCGC AD-155-C09]
MRFIMYEDNDTIILGLDEAGRGPVLGPMVIALVKATEKDLKKFEELGFRDSKKLNKSKRNGLYDIIMENYEVKTIILEANEIDSMIEKTNLNNIEIGVFSKLINKVLKEEYNIKKGNMDDIYCNKKIKIYIDACSNDERAFKNKIKSKLIFHNKNIEIIAEHGADDKYKIVSAASIIAKVVRDRIIDNYKNIYGEIGSGYPSDRITINYLKNYIKEHGELPDIARKCWKTSKNIMKNNNKRKEESVNNKNCNKKNENNSNKDKYIQKKLF